ncbi:MAG: VUT family protein [Candidatus Andersenbacteria bacterium]|nr:VUT family protein [Candidatus Andersenbacteria bacterium]
MPSEQLLHGPCLLLIRRRIIWIGLGMQVFAAFAYWIISIWPPAPFWTNQEAFMMILGVAPRITLASLSAYFCGEFANSVVISKMKYGQHGARGLTQAWRYIASTIVGEGVDSLVFMTVGFLGTMATRDLVQTIVTIWIVKVLYEVVATPFSVWFANWVKRVEGVDKIDDPQEVSYNPFRIIRTR